ncbi:hypothetical protein ACLRGI_07600 [Paenarthrobacter nitroguajacolicus]
MKGVIKARAASLAKDESRDAGAKPAGQAPSTGVAGPGRREEMQRVRVVYEHGEQHGADSNLQTCRSVEASWRNPSMNEG